MAKLKYTFILVIVIIIVPGLTFFFNDLSPGLWVLGAVIGILISIALLFHERIIEAIKNRVSYEKQKKKEFLKCPRCKILVEKDLGICPQCNQKL
jgi:uncharacterized protein YqfA (UPF0365 family)